ncbi:MAG: DUF1559 domain-containing protein [Pirellulales bacterium]
MSTSHHRPRCRRRFVGFTLVELLVVITIIGMLMALLIPAVSAVRSRARQTTCANNLRQIGVAVMNFASSKGRFPGYVQPVDQANRGWVQIQGTGMANAGFVSQDSTPDSREKSRISWAGVILPQMERQDLWDNLRTVDSTEDSSGSDARRRVIPLESYVCPDDTDAASSPENAALTYIANAGAWDWNRSKYLTPPGFGDTADNGLFHNLTLGKVTTKLGGNIRDGAATTLMLSENIHKNPLYCWLGVSGDQFGEQHFGMNWVVNGQPDGASTAPTNQARISLENPRVLDVTTADSQGYPYYSRPASTHPGNGVNVIFADGHGDVLVPEIEYVVFQQLMTPNGRKCEDPDQNVGPIPPGVHPVIEQFRRAAPISEKDLE